MKIDIWAIGISYTHLVLEESLNYPYPHISSAFRSDLLGIWNMDLLRMRMRMRSTSASKSAGVGDVPYFWALHVQPFS